MNALAAFWDNRPPRQRTLLSAVGLVVAVALVIAFAWLPLERSRARLTARIPELRASIVSMQREADEAKRLRALPPAKSLDEPVSSLAAAPPAGAQVTPLDARRVRLAGNDVAFTTLIEWILAAQASHGLHVESARLDALAAPGRVKADLVMTRS